MKVKEFQEKLGLKILAGSDYLDKDAEGIYCCDLLSWVMSHGNKGNVWITVQIHPNVIAVATLLEFSCVIVPEDIAVEEVSLEKAENEQIPVFQSSLDSVDLIVKLKELGL